MRLRNIIAAAVMTGGWLAACSTPASRDAQHVAPNGAGGSRHILLAEAPGLPGAVASDLEVRRAAKAATSRRAEQKEAAQQPERPVMGEVAPVQVMRMTTSSMADAPRSLDLAPVPVAPTIPLAPTVGEGGHTTFDDPYHHAQAEDGRRGPAIIIRGGMGGPDDKCDLRPRGYRGGIAINRTAPSFGGGIGRGSIR